MGVPIPVADAPAEIPIRFAICLYAALDAIVIAILVRLIQTPIITKSLFSA